MYEEQRYKPISAWGYFGYSLLFAIPVAGLVLLIVFSFSNNINLRNYARSHFCGLIVFAALFAAVFAVSVFLPSLGREISLLFDKLTRYF